MEKTRGGIRSNAGRKPSANPKSPMTLYVENSIIQSYGGQKAFREHIYKTIKTQHNGTNTHDSVQEQ